MMCSPRKHPINVAATITTSIMCLSPHEFLSGSDTYTVTNARGRGQVKQEVHWGSGLQRHTGASHAVFEGLTKCLF